MAEKKKTARSAKKKPAAKKKAAVKKTPAKQTGAAQGQENHDQAKRG